MKTLYEPCLSNQLDINKDFDEKIINFFVIKTVNGVRFKVIIPNSFCDLILAALFLKFKFTKNHPMILNTFKISVWFETYNFLKV